MARNFDNFKPVQGVADAVKLFKDLANGAGWFMLLCYGGVGCGKTHLCEALASSFKEKGVFCRVIEWNWLIRNLKSAMNNEYKGSYDTLFREYQRLKIMILDDVGMGSSGSNWEWGELEEIINYRYENHLPTVVTTNLDIRNLPPRIVSRFGDAVRSRKVLITAGDYRPLKVEDV